jgi:hypothetical protein
LEIQANCARVDNDDRMINDPIVMGTSSFSWGRTIMDHPTCTQTLYFLHL